jgi:hypothetical protein
MIPDSGATWYWPTSGVLKGNTLAVFAYHVESASGPPGFDWSVRGTVVARFALPSLQLLGPPTDMPVTRTAEPPTALAPFPGAPSRS